MLLRRTFFLFILLLIAAVLGYRYWQQPLQAPYQAPPLANAMVDKQQRQQIQDRIAQSDTSPVYILSEDHWTSFSIPDETLSLRVVTQATLPGHVQGGPGIRWHYQLQYEFLDENDQLLLKRDYAYDAGLKLLVDATRGESFSPSFYLDPHIQPSDGRIVVLNLTPISGARSMRVRILQADPMIVDVALRVYRDERIPEFRVAHRWLRLSDKQKQRLARGNVYDQELLAEQEILNLLRIKVQPIGPTGIAGSHYHSRTLYTMRQYEGESMTPPLLYRGFYVDAYTHGMVPLPEGGGRLRLRFSPLEPSPAVGSRIKLNWYGRLQKERGSMELNWRGQRGEYVRHWDGGLLEIIATGSLAVRVFLTPEGELEREITPEKRLLRTFIAEPGQPVVYAVDHIHDDPTPFRIDVRQQLLAGQQGGSIRFRYALIDPYGKVIGDGYAESTPPISRYARLPQDTMGMRLSEPSSHYFALPVGVRSIRLYGPTSLLFHAYTRPERLVRLSRVPEDSFKSEDPYDRQPSWFSIKPKQYHYLLASHRSLLLSIQSRPPQANEDMLAGRYQWEDLHPEQAYLQRLFTPLQPGDRPRDAALPSLYCPMATNRTVRQQFHSPDGERQISPRLAYFRQQKTPFYLRLYVDNRLHYHGRMAGTDGEIPLLPIRSGSHRIRIESESRIDFYLNHCRPVAGALLRRTSNRFDGRPLLMRYKRGHHAKETLAMRLYTPHGSTERSTIRVQLMMPSDRVVGPVSSWSFVNRRFDVRPVPIAGQTARVAAYRRNTTDLGRPFSIPITENVPAGDYLLRIELEQGPGGYLLLSRIVPGAHGQRDVKLEKELQYVHLSE